MISHDIFLSHSSLDKDFVIKLANALQSKDISVWYDKWEIKVGDSLSKKISEGITQSTWLAVVLSNKSVKSTWVEKELNAAMSKELADKKVVVLPILIEECSIPLFLQDKKYADFRTNFEFGLEDILDLVMPKNAKKISVVFDREVHLATDLFENDLNRYAEGTTVSKNDFQIHFGKKYLRYHKLMVDNYNLIEEDDSFDHSYFEIQRRLMNKMENDIDRISIGFALIINSMPKKHSHYIIDTCYWYARVLLEKSIYEYYFHQFKKSESKFDFGKTFLSIQLINYNPGELKEIFGKFYKRKDLTIYRVFNKNNQEDWDEFYGPNNSEKRGFGHEGYAHYYYKFCISQILESTIYRERDYWNYDDVVIEDRSWFAENKDYFD